MVQKRQRHLEGLYKKTHYFVIILITAMVVYKMV